MPFPFLVAEHVLKTKRHKLALTLATAFSLSMFSSFGQAYSPEQQRLCTDDAFRLCSSEIPDVDRITACMTRQRELLSPGCKAFFTVDEPVAPNTSKKYAPARGGKPVDRSRNPVQQ